ncbi:YbaK/ProRS associated domain-containing protein [Fragilariopsis cylindrus CCMP1102]|uniref:YbaK/ProRS associated domain-containing protein n=1 Tax=Fragilariopsis cylindrus CCMP1102 TaxID=635003 RepID=A0A1E7FXI7_9STRA|nr:YbaK/ProRS associated domain-containing protein [Fragilariopsis cylindrus CCMP1102]|eukprot:OEU22860.1 YbaK/ProRS associated domain-containing protein [Fragilariopsis cylindrus CCMP1102]
MTDTALEDRIIALERTHYKCPPEVEIVDESMRRARTEIETLGLYSSRWMWVPSDYYNWTLEQRASMLQAPTTRLLCKSLLLENKKVTPETYNFVYNPRFVLVVLQYDSELDVSLLTKSIRKLQPIVEERLDPSDFDWRVADSDDNDRITGYKFNSVTPFGLNEEVPIILSSAIANLGYFWMGGGHVHLKLGLSVSDFVDKVKNVKVMEVSVPRIK